MNSGETLNPMPPTKTDEELSNEFSNYILHEIEKHQIKTHCH